MSAAALQFQPETEENEPILVDFEAEDRFLAWCLVGAAALRLATPCVFWLPENRLFFEVLCEIEADGAKAACDDVIARLRDSGRLVEAGGAARIRQMFAEVEPAGDAARCAGRLGQLRRMRRAREAALGAAVAIGHGRLAEATALLREATQSMRAA